MKFILYILIILSFSKSFAQSDTLNKIDDKQMKQGYWVVYFDNTNKILEEGNYKDDKRIGVWIQHLENGTISSEITYVNDEPNGYAKIYYPSGQIAEEGLWKNDVWVGKYKAYYENGKLNYKWNFSEDGQRTGIQEYYHENGKKMIEGNWEKGLESGVIKRYNENGKLIQEQTFDNGKINPELTVNYKIEPISPAKETTKTVNIKDTTNNKTLDAFTSTGERKLYDKKRRLTHEGYFKNGKLIKGRKYFYDSNNKLIKTEIYNKGKLYNTIIPKE